MTYTFNEEVGPLSDNKLVIRPKRAKGDDGYKTFSIRIREEVVGKIDTISSQTGRSRNELIGVFLEYAIAHCTVQEKVDTKE